MCSYKLLIQHPKNRSVIGLSIIYVLIHLQDIGQVNDLAGNAYT